MLDAIDGCRSRSAPNLPFIHVWNNYDLAHPPKDYSRVFLPVFPGACGRDSANVLNDPKRIPYLKDCLRMALQRANQPDAFVCLSRPETKFTNQPNAFLDGADAGFCYRMTRNGDGDTFSPIVDMLVARKSWWQKHLAEIPDLLFGTDYFWSEALRVLFQKHGAADVTGVCYRMAKEKV